MDYRCMFSSDWTRSWDLGGEERTVTITKVAAGELEDPRRKKKDKKPVISMKGWPKPLALNKTNARTIAGMYGNQVEKWVGKRVTLYTDQTRDPSSGQNVDCIRIRPSVPQKQGEPAPLVAPPVGEPDDNHAEPGSNG
ncbi:MAG TPA: hypothetical protein VFB66_03810 [Tepidisphaeraceae bacterium]|nr:hypothetical protein [Tepidisphaeraceae bacterium]